MRSLLQDIRHAAASLHRSTAFTALAICTLAIGIAANTTIFALIKHVLLKPLPYPEAERLVMLWERDARAGIDQEKATGPDFIDWQAQSDVFERMGFWFGGLSTNDFNLVTQDGTSKVRARYASSALFGVMGVRPLLGRTFVPEEDRYEGHAVAVISYALWKGRFGGNSGILGSTVRVDTYGRRDYAVVGVMPPGFDFPDACELWLPAGWMGVRLDDRRSGHWHSVIARLKPHVTIGQARAEMNAIQARIRKEHPGDLIGSEAAVVPLLEQTVGAHLRLALFIIWGAVACVLLIACANMANLLLVRGTARAKEIALRLALGASRWRVVRYLLVESVLLALLGGAAGIVLSVWALHVVMTFGAGRIPRVDEVSLDGGVLLFTIFVSLMTAVLFGLAPAWQVSNADLNQALKEGRRGIGGGPRHNRMRNVLVVGEIAASLVLLIAAGLMARSFFGLMQIDRGFQPDHLLTARLDFSVSGFGSWVDPTPARPQVTLQQMIERISSSPGVRSVAAISRLPDEATRTPNQPIVLEGQAPGNSASLPVANFQGITPQYFGTMGIPLLRGRSFAESDVFEAPQVVIVNEMLARRYFPGNDPIGKRLALGGRDHPGQPDSDPRTGNIPWKQIVGVVADTRNLTADAQTVPDVYVPYWQWPMQNPALVVRASGDSGVVAARIAGDVHAVNRNVPLPAIRAMNEIIGEAVAQPRFQTLLLSTFGMIAMILAAVGIYGVISYSVAQRRHEIAIRMALGAQRNDVVNTVLAQGVGLIVLGLAIGIAGALMLTRMLTTLLYGIKPMDASAYAGSTAFLAIVALVACYIPAHHATKVNPVTALRGE